MENINIPIYRAKVLGLDNNYIIGFYQQYIEGFENNIYHEINNTLIDPTTISINFPNMTDSQGNKIFASLNENGKGGDIFILGDERLKYIAMMHNNQLMAKQQNTYGSFIGQGYAPTNKWKVIGIQK